MTTKIRVRVLTGKSVEMRDAAYHRIVHQHLRYADIGFHISEIDDDESPFIEFMIEVKNKRWAQRVIERIKSFSDQAEVIT